MYKEEDFKKMANDPKFMADRWLARAKASDKEMIKREGSLSREEKVKKHEQIKEQYKRAEMYKQRAKKV